MVKRIQVSGRKIETDWLSLGVQDDNLVETLEFELPVKYGEVDLSQGIPYVRFETDVESGFTTPQKVIEGESLVLKWGVPAEVTRAGGEVKLQIKISGLQSEIWHSEPATFCVKKGLGSVTPEPMALLAYAAPTLRTGAPESEPPITVAERKINIPKELQNIAVQNDENSETVKIVCPRYFDDHDLGQYDFYLHTVSTGGLNPDIYFSDQEKNISSTEVELTWTLKPPETSYAGNLSIQLKVLGQDFQWSSDSASVNIIRYLEGEPVIPITPDIYDKFISDISAIKDQAKVSEANARASESNAALSAEQAASSSTAAQAAASTAENSATAASESETNARASETAAKTSETNAASSATKAKEEADRASSIVTGYLGWYATPEALKADHPTGENGWYAIVGSTIWTWDSGFGEWVETSGGTSDYDELLNKPAISGVVLTGDRPLSDFGGMTKPEIAVFGNMPVFGVDKNIIDSGKPADQIALLPDALALYIHSKTGSVHALTGSGGSVKFLATADFFAGDTFTVNGVEIAARTMDNRSLSGSAFKSGDWVLGVLAEDGLRLACGESSAYPRLMGAGKSVSFASRAGKLARVSVNGKTLETKPNPSADTSPDNIATLTGVENPVFTAAGGGSSNSRTLAAALYSLPNGVRDEYDGALLTKRVGKIVLDGTEAWVQYANRPESYCAYIPINNAIPSSTNMYATHAAPRAYASTLLNSVVLGNPNGLSLLLSFAPQYLSSADLAGFKAYLAAQAAAGTPVTVLYELVTPAVTAVDCDLALYDGDNTVSCSDPVLEEMETREIDPREAPFATRARLLGGTSEADLMTALSNKANKTAPEVLYAPLFEGISGICQYWKTEDAVVTVHLEVNKETDIVLWTNIATMPEGYGPVGQININFCGNSGGTGTVSINATNRNFYINTYISPGIKGFRVDFSYVAKAKVAGL